MKELTAQDVRDLVENALSRLPQNPLQFTLAEKDVYNVNGTWWAMLEIQVEPETRSVVWDQIAEVEELIEEENPDANIFVTAA